MEQQIKKVIEDIEQLKGEILTVSEIKNIVSCLNMGVSPECMMYAIDIAILKTGRVSIRYAALVAENWFMNGYNTLAEAKAYVKSLEKPKKNKNEVVLENGIRHDLTGDEILVLQILLERAEAFLKNKDNVTYFDEHREQQILSAAASLKSLFVDHLD